MTKLGDEGQGGTRSEQCVVKIHADEGLVRICDRTVPQFQIINAEVMFRPKYVRLLDAREMHHCKLCTNICKQLYAAGNGTCVTEFYSQHSA